MATTAISTSAHEPTPARRDVADDLRPIAAARLTKMRDTLDWLENHGGACADDAHDDAMQRLHETDR
jgi:hypothetical protein